MLLVLSFVLGFMLHSYTHTLQVYFTGCGNKKLFTDVIFQRDEINLPQLLIAFRQLKLAEHVCEY